MAKKQGSKSRTVKARPPKGGGADALLRLMSEVISLREKLAQAELAAYHSRLLVDVPVQKDTAKASSKDKIKPNCRRPPEKHRKS